MCSFKSNIAMNFGIHEAIVAQFLWNCFKEERNCVTLHSYGDDRWCRCSMIMMKAHFPFLSVRQIQKAISELVKGKMIKKGCFNENRFDKTNWYAFTPFGMHLMEEGEEYESEV